MSNTVLSNTKDNVRTITLNRPLRLNAMNSQMLSELCLALDEANADHNIGAIVLRGAGRSFCSGDDLKDFDSQARSEQDALAFIESIQDVTRRIVLGETTVIGAIHGWAVGGGLEWAINCDLAVFADTTRCFFPELKWGMFPTGGVTYLLPKTIGLVKTRELMLLGEVFDAGEALKMGLAWKVVPEDSVYDIAHQAAQRIAALPRNAVTDLKKVLNQVNADALELAIKLETEATVRGFLDPETHNRLREFID
ncbi:MAG: enoyl-CoA hydratase/isomerase family protein [Acidiferrobacterales bacterium]|nr:enoyl-CoA hydratase/isomerase family protein [Acidiferrobacterales bacterium]